MQRHLLYAKLHRLTVTQADLHYVGSLTLDLDLMEAAHLLPGERVDVVDVDNGNRLTTYVIEGERGSGTVCINGAAARLIAPGDTVIVIAYAAMDEAEARSFTPHVVFVDRDNRVVDIGGDPASVPEGYELIPSPGALLASPTATHADHSAEAPSPDDTTRA